MTLIGYVLMAVWFGISAGVVGQKVVNDQHQPAGNVYRIGIDYYGKTQSVCKEGPVVEVHP